MKRTFGSRSLYFSSGRWQCYACVALRAYSAALNFKSACSSCACECCLRAEAKVSWGTAVLRSSGASASEGSVVLVAGFVIWFSLGRCRSCFSRPLRMLALVTSPQKKLLRWISAMGSAPVARSRRSFGLGCAQGFAYSRCGFHQALRCM